MADTSLFLYNDKWGRTSPRVITLNWKITAAKTVVGLPLGAPILTSFDAIASQAAIDNFLGTTNEFNYLAFDATAMGADAFACIVNMQGQAARVDGFACRVLSGTGSATVNQCGTWNNGITASTLETACALGANGNIAVKCSFAAAGAIDALTAGFVTMSIYWSALK